MRKLITILLMVLFTASINSEKIGRQRVAFFRLDMLSDAGQKVLKEEVKKLGIVFEDSPLFSERTIHRAFINTHIQRMVVTANTAEDIKKLKDINAKLSFGDEFFEEYKDYPLNDEFRVHFYPAGLLSEWKREELVKRMKEMGVVTTPESGEHLYKIDEKADKIVVYTNQVNISAIGDFSNQLRSKGKKHYEEELKSLAKEQSDGKALVESFSKKAPQYGLIIKIFPKSNKEKVIHVLMSFLWDGKTVPTWGGRLMSRTIPFDGTKTMIGLMGDEKDYKSIIMSDDIFYYLPTEMDRQENGMFQLSKVEGEENKFRLKGVYWMYNHLFTVDRIIKEAEEVKLYQHIAKSKETKAAN